MSPRILKLSLAIIVASSDFAFGQPQPSAPGKRPNILFVVTDDQRFDTIRALGNREIHTPTLDKLAQRGFVFHNAYCQGSMVPAVCTPSRTMLLTGQSLFRIPQGKANAKDAPPDMQSLGGLFRQAGFATLFIGKPGNGYTPGNKAFETAIFHNSGKGDDSSFMASQTIQWLKTRPKDRPFFAYLGPSVPHDPRVAPAEFMRMYDPAKITLPKSFMPQHPFDNGELKIRDELLAPHPRTPDTMKRHLAEYYACISCFDHYLGTILDELERAGELDNTVIVFTSDHGLAVGGMHGLMGKQNLYEHNKPPLIFAGPGIPKGQSNALVYLYDLLPTVCARTGIEAPKRSDGKSLMPIMTGEAKGVRDVVFGAYRDCQRMVREERWKLIWYPKIDRFQLFDLQNDPDELRELQDRPENAARLIEMRRLLASQQEAFADDKAPRLKASGDR